VLFEGVIFLDSNVLKMGNFLDCGQNYGKHGLMVFSRNKIFNKNLEVSGLAKK
jgi:hypothetical protein